MMLQDQADPFLPGLREEIAVRPGRRIAGRLAWLGTADEGGFVTRAVPDLDLGPEGIPGDRHGGFLRGADARTPWYTRGEPIHNERQLSILSREELDAVAEDLALPRIEPEWLGGNLVLAGVPSLSFLPRGTRMTFPSGATLAVTDQNAPCRIVGRSLAEHYPGDERLEFRFVEVARRRRGLVALVERPGRIAAGDSVKLRVPEQWLWSA